MAPPRSGPPITNEDGTGLGALLGGSGMRLVSKGDSPIASLRSHSPVVGSATTASSSVTVSALPSKTRI